MFFEDGTNKYHPAAVSTRVRLIGISATTLLIFVIAMTFPATTVADRSPLGEVIASAETVAALQTFGTDTEGNHCPILFGGISVRPDEVVRLRVRDGERDSKWDPGVRSTIVEYSRRGDLIAWVDYERWALFLTHHYYALARRVKLAVLFHEVRGHWELRLSDRQMLSVLSPNDVDSENTHLISLAILSGCQALRGLTTEDVYRVLLKIGPLAVEE